MNWRKSSHSTSGSCTEVGQDGTVVLVRDSQLAESPVLAFDAVAWAAFLAMVRQT
jgi:hypothetical protein